MIFVWFPLLISLREQESALCLLSVRVLLLSVSSCPLPFVSCRFGYTRQQAPRRLVRQNLGPTCAEPNRKKKKILDKTPRAACSKAEHCVQTSQEFNDNLWGLQRVFIFLSKDWFICGGWISPGLVWSHPHFDLKLVLIHIM